MSNRECKQMIEDVSNIVRRRPNDPLFVTRMPVSISTSFLPAADGLCRELQEIFEMVAARDLPFAPMDAEEEHDSPRSPAGEEVSDIEKVRRHSGQDESQISSSHAPFANADDGYGYGEDQQYDAFGGGDDYQPDMQSYQGDYPADTSNRLSAADYNLKPLGPPMSSKHQLAALMEQSRLADDSNVSALGIDSTDDANAPTTSVDSLNPEKWNSRTKIVFDILKTQLTEKDDVSFKSLAEGSNRRVAASCFLEMLQLKTWGLISVEQRVPFGDINVKATESLWTVAQQ